MRQVTPEDLIEYGMIPELIGRLPIITALDELTEKLMVNILTEPKNALIRQYNYFFTMENAELEFTPSALSLIAQRAMDRHTGARGLRSVVEEVMLELMYDLPDRDNKGIKYVLDAAAIEQSKPLDELVVAQKESA
jgi:ATP-dependent Clp protease ATP-binding subunit ClpX